MKTDKTRDVTQKAEIYHTLYEINAAFAAIVVHCQTLQQVGVLSHKYTHRFQSFTQELQSEVNGELLENLDHIEERDWARFGKVRDKWEKYLRGPQERSSGRSI
jgi:hypothetical protein